MKRHQKIRLKIEKLGADGAGMAVAEKRKILVRGALPGDVVDATVVGLKRHSARVRVDEYLSRSIERIPAECRHYDVCGGCRWQDVSYDIQCGMKQGMVREALSGIPGVEFSGEVEVTPSPDRFYYRNKMEYTIDGPPKAEGRIFIGLHESGKYNSVFDLYHCHLQSEASNRLVDATRTFITKRGLSAYGLKSHEGLLRFLMIRDGKNTGDLMANLVTSGEDFPEAGDYCDYLREAVPETTTVIRSINHSKSGVTYGDEREVLFGDGTITEEIGGLKFVISPDSFFQTNPRQTINLYNCIREFACLSGGDRVLDLYCGTGTIGLYMAEHVTHVTGVELVGDAVRDARRNAELNGVGNVEFIEGKVEDVIDTEMSDFDVVICDPPRVGLHPKAMAELVRMRIPRMVYVSCNIKALPGDLEMLAMAGYRLTNVRAFDMSPHTPHIETVVNLAL